MLLKDPVQERHQSIDYARRAHGDVVDYDARRAVARTDRRWRHPGSWCAHRPRGRRRPLRGSATSVPHLPPVEMPVGPSSSSPRSIRVATRSATVARPMLYRCRSRRRSPLRRCGRGAAPSPGCRVRLARRGEAARSGSTPPRVSCSARYAPPTIPAMALSIVISVTVCARGPIRRLDRVTRRLREAACARTRRTHGVARYVHFQRPSGSPVTLEACDSSVADCTEMPEQHAVVGRWSRDGATDLRRG